MCKQETGLLSAPCAPQRRGLRPASAARNLFPGVVWCPGCLLQASYKRGPFVLAVHYLVFMWEHRLRLHNPLLSVVLPPKDDLLTITRPQRLLCLCLEIMVRGGGRKETRALRTATPSCQCPARAAQPRSVHTCTTPGALSVYVLWRCVACVAFALAGQHVRGSPVLRHEPHQCRAGMEAGGVQSASSM
jgi:hypothetical protein